MRQKRHLLRTQGIVLGQNAHYNRALVIKVKRGDTIIILQKAPCDMIGFLHVFKINENFEPVSGNVRPLKEAGAASKFSQIEIDYGPDAHMDDLDLRILYRSQHPKWMRDTMEEQIIYWREHSMRKYLSVAPQDKIIPDLKILVHKDPLRALRDYKILLTESQIATCVRKDPHGGMLHAFEKVPRRLRKAHLAAHARHLLENHLHQLTNAELRICTAASPKEAFLRRDQLALRQHSIVLARSYGVVWHTLIGDARKGFRDEALQSLTQFPEEWMRVSTNGLDEIFNRMRHLLGIVFDPMEIRTLLNKMPPRGKSLLASYVASRV